MANPSPNQKPNNSVSDLSGHQDLARRAENYQRRADQLRTMACLAMGRKENLDIEIARLQNLANQNMRLLAKAEGRYEVIISTDPPELKPDAFSFDHLGRIMMPEGIGFHPHYRNILRKRRQRRDLEDN